MHGCYVNPDGECSRCILDSFVMKNESKSQETESMVTDNVTNHENERKETDSELMDYEPIAHRTRSCVNQNIGSCKNVGAVVYEEMNESIASSENISSVHDETSLHCDNCRRYSNKRDSERNDQLQLEVVDSADVHRRKKYSILRSGTNQFLLCRECHKYLSGFGSEFDQWQYLWPSWVWKLLRSDFLIADIGIFVWSMIPMSWRHWWFPAIEGTALYGSGIGIH